MDMKTCTGCEVEEPINDYYKYIMSVPNNEMNKCKCGKKNNKNCINNLCIQCCNNLKIKCKAQRAVNKFGNWK